MTEFDDPIIVLYLWYDGRVDTTECRSNHNSTLYRDLREHLTTGGFELTEREVCTVAVAYLVVVIYTDHACVEIETPDTSDLGSGVLERFLGEIPTMMSMAGVDRDRLHVVINPPSSGSTPSDEEYMRSHIRASLELALSLRPIHMVWDGCDDMGEEPFTCFCGEVLDKDNPTHFHDRHHPKRA